MLRLVVSAGSIALLAGVGVSRGDVARPNVLFIAVDDLRTSLGCYGDTTAQSPHIDAFARTGIRFDRAYCNQAVCGPSRASLLTGRLPDHIRVWHNRSRFRDSQPELVTLPQLFRNNGYHTQSIGKVFSGRLAEDDPLSWSVPSTLSRRGWRNYVLPGNRGTGKQAATERADVADTAYRDGQIAELAVKTLEDLCATDRPFFLAVGFSRPHLPFSAPSKYWELYDPADFARNDAGRPQGAPEVAYSEQMELGGYRDVSGDEHVAPAQAVQLRHGYYACVSYVDAQVGRVLRTIDRLGVREKTIVVLWSDHGFSLGEAGHWCKKTNFELDTRVPLIIRAAGVTRGGTETDALVELVDLYPTLAELAGLQPPATLDGSSLLPVLRDPARAGRDLALSQHSRPFKASGPQVMGYSLRSPTQRYTRWVRWPDRELIAEELYDYSVRESVVPTAESWIEANNLIGHPEYAGVASEFRERLSQVLVQRGLVTAANGGSKCEP